MTSVKGGPHVLSTLTGSQLASRADQISHLVAHRLHCVWAGLLCVYVRG